MNGVSHLNRSLKDCVVYRGQKNSEWNLCPSIFRKNREGEYIYENKERIFYKSLVEHNHPEFKKNNTIFDKVAMMQHYSIPTRLLDWTKNPLVGLYFATEKCIEKKMIWIKKSLKTVNYMYIVQILEIYIIQMI
ncbi:FRG domain-containing protein [Methanococcus maripaludis]|uniref:FRG domain-containing protein n=1 Tax=Methanococcus maripaludis TaxID=39152 RepID=UPI00373AE6EB